MQTLTENQVEMVSGGLMNAGPVTFIAQWLLGNALNYVIAHRDHIVHGLEKSIPKEPSSGDIPFM